MRRLDLAPAGPSTLPDAGIGRGWESGLLLTATLLLVSFGLVTLYSASVFLAQRQGLPDWYYVVRQAGGAVAGLGALWVCACIPYRTWRFAAWPLVIVVAALLIVVVLPGTTTLAPEINGARRWIVMGGITVQPSELAKLAVVVWTAAVAVRKADRLGSLTRGVLPFLMVWALLVGPIIAEPNLSAACLVALLGGIVLFAAGGRIGHFVFLGLLAVPFLGAQLAVSFRTRRIATFLEPGSDLSDAGFQVHQSLVAIGSGGLTGAGFGEGRQKFGFLPEAHNDFIFAMVGEEWGLLGVVFLITLYTAIVVVGMRVARCARDEFAQLLALGLTGIVGLQALLHMAVGLGLVPATGLALPLVSYGRSNQVVTLAAIGILMAVARAMDPEGGRARVHPRTAVGAGGGRA